MATSPFDLASVFKNAEAIRGMRRQGVLDELQTQYLQGQIARAPAQEQRAAAQEQRAAAAESRTQSQFDQEQALMSLRLANMAAAETAQNPAAAKRWSTVLKAIDPHGGWDVPAGATPEQIQAGAKQLYESTTAALRAYEQGGAQGADGVQSTQVLNNGNLALVMRDGTIRDTGQQVRPQIVVRDVNGVPTVVTATGNNTSVTPLSTIEQEAGAAGQIAGAQASARTAAETEGARQQKAPALATLEYVADQFLPIIEKTAQGGPLGVIGRAGTVFDYEDATRFDNLREQLSTELRTVFRIPGEGTLSDREQAQYGLQLPNRNYSPAVNKAILDDLRTRASMRVGMGDAEPDAGGQWTIKQVE